MLNVFRYIEYYFNYELQSALKNGCLQKDHKEKVELGHPCKSPKFRSARLNFNHFIGT